MKDYFDIVLILAITLTVFFCMMFFAEEIIVQQKAVHLRNRIVEQMEINGGYTIEAKTAIDQMIADEGPNIQVTVSKSGKLNFGEKVEFEVIVFYQRRLPFNANGETIKYVVKGEYYNVYG